MNDPPSARRRVVRCNSCAPRRGECKAKVASGQKVSMGLTMMAEKPAPFVSARDGNAARPPAQVPLQRRSTHRAKIFTPPVDPLASAAYSAASPQGEPPGEALWGGVAQLVRA
ncbi:MAG: hypothetical protein VX218_02020, partial [Pseudomonadota bacterium]|nr:hypothetical protein [Pseudomonadota bacterium]